MNRWKQDFDPTKQIVALTTKIGALKRKKYQERMQVPHNYLPPASIKTNMRNICEASSHGALLRMVNKSKMRMETYGIGACALGIF